MSNLSKNESVGQIRSGTPEYRRVNLALFCAGFITFVTLYDVQPLMPIFSKEFGVSPAAASLPLSCATMTLAIGMLLAGTVSETLGRRSLMSVALFLTSFMALATYFTHSFESLLILRLFQGLILAGVPSVAMAYIGEEMDITSMGHAMGLYISGNALGGMSGRIGSSLLCEFMPWRSALAVIGAVGIFLSLIFLRSLPPSSNFKYRPFRIHYLFTSLYHNLREPGLLCLYSLAFLSMGGFVSLYNYIGFRLLASPYNLGHSQVSLIFLVYLLGSLSSGVVGKLVQRFNRGLVIKLSLLVMFTGTLITLASSIYLIVLGVAIFTWGFFSAHATASSWVGHRAITARAQAASLYLFSYYLGSSISGTIGGMFWQHFGWLGVAAMISLLMLIALGVSLLLVHLNSTKNNITKVILI